MDVKQEMKKLVEEFTDGVAALARKMTIAALDEAFNVNADIKPTQKVVSAYAKTAEKEATRLTKKVRKQAKRTIKRVVKKAKRATKDERADAKADARRAWRVRQKVRVNGLDGLSEDDRTFILAYNEEHPDPDAKKEKKVA